MRLSLFFYYVFQTFFQFFYMYVISNRMVQIMPKNYTPPFYNILHQVLCMRYLPWSTSLTIFFSSPCYLITRSDMSSTSPKLLTLVIIHLNILLVLKKSVTIFLFISHYFLILCL